MDRGLRTILCATTERIDNRLRIGLPILPSSLQFEVPPSIIISVVIASIPIQDTDNGALHADCLVVPAIQNIRPAVENSAFEEILKGT